MRAEHSLQVPTICCDSLQGAPPPQPPAADAQWLPPPRPLAAGATIQMDTTLMLPVTQKTSAYAVTQSPPKVGALQNSEPLITQKCWGQLSPGGSTDSVGGKAVWAEHLLLSVWI